MAHESKEGNALFVPVGRSDGSMWGTTPPWEMTTEPRSCGGISTRQQTKRATHLAQLLVVADGELQVARHDTVLLVVARGVARELEDFCGEVFEDGGEVH
jgi:hypothetical protein